MSNIFRRKSEYYKWIRVSFVHLFVSKLDVRVSDPPQYYEDGGNNQQRVLELMSISSDRGGRRPCCSVWLSSVSGLERRVNHSHFRIASFSKSIPAKADWPYSYWPRGACFCVWMLSINTTGATVELKKKKKKPDLFSETAHVQIFTAELLPVTSVTCVLVNTL